MSTWHCQCVCMEYRWLGREFGVDGTCHMLSVIYVIFTYAQAAALVPASSQTPNLDSRFANTHLCNISLKLYSSSEWRALASIIAVRLQSLESSFA
mmetsp:Transcript_136984/g.266541  ORF Transcript_136984/g.266541 Transcript_136984/m.266541 type:complete len:96 (+) Transcript_136984:980-1267(+)